MRKIINAVFKYSNQDYSYNMLKIQCAEQTDRLTRQADKQTTSTPASTASMNQKKYKILLTNR